LEEFEMKAINAVIPLLFALAPSLSQAAPMAEGTWSAKNCKALAHNMSSNTLEIISEHDEQFFMVRTGSDYEGHRSGAISIENFTNLWGESWSANEIPFVGDGDIQKWEGMAKETWQGKDKGETFIEFTVDKSDVETLTLFFGEYGGYNHGGQKLHRIMRVNSKGDYVSLFGRETNGVAKYRVQETCGNGFGYKLSESSEPQVESGKGELLKLFRKEKVCFNLQDYVDLVRKYDVKDFTLETQQGKTFVNTSYNLSNAPFFHDVNQEGCKDIYFGKEKYSIESGDPEKQTLTLIPLGQRKTDPEFGIQMKTILTVVGNPISENVHLRKLRITEEFENGYRYSFLNWNKETVGDGYLTEEEKRP
jgi:hypothetical protein